MLICVYYTEGVAPLLPSLLFLWALYLSMSDKPIPSSPNVPLTFSGVFMTLWGVIDSNEELRSITSVFFGFSLCHNMEVVLE